MSSSLPPRPAPAIVLAEGFYDAPHGKTAHGLVRGSDRFQILAIIDSTAAGRDAGELLDGRDRGIPVHATVAAALEALPVSPTHAVVGIATHGGRFTPELRKQILHAVDRGLHLANGLHDAAADDPEISAAARVSGATLMDLRRPRPKSELHFWEGSIHSVRAPRIAVLGTDCALGKRTTTRLLVETLTQAGIAAEMIYTGQTGWMQGARYGFMLDATYNDYVSGELEHAIVTCDQEASPDVMILEGQSSLRNPSGPCGAELLLSGGAGAVVLQHASGRRHFDGFAPLGLAIPSLENEIELIRHYGANTVAVTLNGEGLGVEALADIAAVSERELGIPVIRPLEEGLARLIPVVEGLIEAERSEQRAGDTA